MKRLCKLLDGPPLCVKPDAESPGDGLSLLSPVSGLPLTPEKVGDEVRTYDFSTPESTRDAIRYECVAQGLTLSAQIAYVLATVEHEANDTWKPVREAYWKSEDWRKRNLRYWPYYGRGYVQITWEENYKKFSDILGFDLVKEPDLALDPAFALTILVYGFKHGSFTGKKLEDYVRERHVDFRNARRCINGLDKANLIALLAEKWLKGESGG